MSKCKTSCRYKVYDPCSYIHEVKHVILQNPMSIQSLRSTLLYTRRDACDTRQKRTDRCNSNSVLRSFLNARPKKHNCIGELTFRYVFITTIIFYCTSSTFEGGSRHML